MLKLSAGVRSLSCVSPHDIETGAPSPHPHHSALFILHGKKVRGCSA